MNVIAWKTLDKFIKKHTDAKGQILSWYQKTNSSVWSGPQDIKNEYRTAGFLKKQYRHFQHQGKFISISCKSLLQKQNSIYKVDWNSRRV